MAFIKAGSFTKLPAGSMVRVEVGGVEMALCHAEAGVRAIGNTCPHAGGPIAEGALHGDMAVCPWHAWEYDCRTGRNDYDPDIGVPVYPVRIEGDDILVDPDAGVFPEGG